MSWQIKLIKPSQTIRSSIFKLWQLVLSDMEDWMRRGLVFFMVYGGMGIQGISQTDFYKWITSPEGLSELGIPPTEPPKLLESYYKNSFKIVKSGRSIALLFGDEIQLKLDTWHPFTGHKKLNIGSWLTWIVDGVPVTDAGFVSRDEIQQDAPQIASHIRLHSPLGGLMLPKNALGLSSTGKWEVLMKYQNYDIEWIRRNAVKIADAIIKQLETLIILRFKI